jgi:transcriptional regulator with XRE-family HTH domain
MPLLSDRCSLYNLRPKHPVLRSATMIEISPGSYLKAARLRLQLALVDVQSMSSKIAASERNKRFYVSMARLTQIENDQYVPTQFKLFTLATIYGLPFNDILRRYGVDTDRAHRHRARLKLDATRPVTSAVENPDRTITLPVRLDPSFKWDRTQLINRAVVLWGEVPVAFLLECNPKKHMYAYIGMRDDTMSPLLKPGALVLIDEHRRAVVNGRWTNESERPIYLVEHRDGYLCRWCEVLGSTLTTIPHPASGAATRSFNLATDADVIGQVVAVAMRLVPRVPASPEIDTTPREQF